MFTNLSHVCIHVADIQRTIGFYRDQLGFPVQYVFERKGVIFGAYFRINEINFIEAFQMADLQVVNTGIVHLCLQTSDIDGCIHELTQKGVACRPKSLGSAKNWTTWIHDPDGNTIEVNETTVANAQFHGGVATVNW